MEACRRLAEPGNTHNGGWPSATPTHDIEKLVALAGLKARRDADIAANTVLEDNWLIVKEWKETARYKATAQLKAEQLYQAITDNANGVLPWIRNHW
jgi:hypothetical protein